MNQVPIELSRQDLARDLKQPLLKLQQIRKSFQQGEGELTVLQGIDLTIYPGEFVAIMGQSGSGKSTLMNILGCLDKPSSGQYWFAGADVAQMSSDDLARLRRDAFGFVFQQYNLLADASASENVQLPALYTEQTKETRKARAASLLSQLGLAERLDHRPNQLSGGQQQRVSIARALMNGGQIILADEPTGALDSHSGEEVMALLQTLSEEGHTIILITHDAKVAAHAQRQIELKDGHIISDTGPVNLVAHTPPAPPKGDAPFVQELFTAVGSAIHCLSNNIFRTVLTLLGIVIGVASVITLMAIGDGAKNAVVESISAMGSNLLLVRPGGPNQKQKWEAGNLMPEDVDAVGELPGIAAALPEQNTSVTLRYGNTDHTTDALITSTSFPAARKWQIAQGTFFSAEDDAQFATVVVLGQSVKQKLFGERNPLGEYIIIRNILFQVVGVMANRGADPGGQDQDDKVFVPFQTGSLRLMGQRNLRSITISVENAEEMDEVQKRVRGLLIERHGAEDFQIRSMSSLIDTVSATQNTMTMLLGAIAAISLLVGGIGVMNIMLVSVTERTREIGIRMATGARQRHILQQFLLEALAVSSLGGLLGVALGLAVALIARQFGTSVYFSLLPVALAFACAFSTGLLFGYLPARKASGLNPVTALSSQ
ncbi:MAG TPA: MacB family efflux pump subunit [Cellvibrionaceae bacterium]